MDIPALSTYMAQSELQADISLALMKKAMENMDTQAEIIQTVNTPNIMTSEHIDVSV